MPRCARVALVGALLSACTQDYDNLLAGSGAAGDGGSAAAGHTSSGGGTTSTTSTSESACPQGLVCAPEAAGGTYARLASGSAPCPAGWGPSVTYGDGVDPGCTKCTCGQAQGGECPDRLSVNAHFGGGCGGPTHSVQRPEGCNVAPSAFSVTGLIVDPPTPTDEGTCSPSEVDEVPAAETTVCTVSGSPGPACAGGSCVPAGDGTFAVVCVVLPENAPCPVGFAQALSLAPIVEDTRECVCGCGDPSGAACIGASVTLYDDGECNGAVVATVLANGQCGAVDFSGGSDRVDVGTWAGGSCQPHASVSGALSFGPAVTVCCTPG